MKLHQQTRKAIAKRQPALMAAIRKFNTYCERLAELHDPSCSIPIPNPLPTKLAELRADQSLVEDVWITPSSGAVPLWISDRDVRSGIRGMLKSDHCLEEHCRLGLEADNLCRWYSNELATIELALLCPESKSTGPGQPARPYVLQMKNSCFSSSNVVTTSSAFAVVGQTPWFRWYSSRVTQKKPFPLQLPLCVERARYPSFGLNLWL